jgi:hypothetical protein
MSTMSTQDPIRTMSAEAHRHAQWALLNELATMLEDALPEAEAVRDDLDKQWPDDDLGLYIRHINLTVEALDALGPREFEEDPPADAPEDEKREGEDR